MERELRRDIVLIGKGSKCWRLMILQGSKSVWQLSRDHRCNIVASAAALKQSTVQSAVACKMHAASTATFLARVQQGDLKCLPYITFLQLNKLLFFFLNACKSFNWKDCLRLFLCFLKPKAVYLIFPNYYLEPCPLRNECL